MPGGILVRESQEQRPSGKNMSPYYETKFWVTTAENNDLRQNTDTDGRW